MRQKCWRIPLILPSPSLPHRGTQYCVSSMLRNCAALPLHRATGPLPSPAHVPAPALAATLATGGGGFAYLPAKDQRRRTPSLCTSNWSRYPQLTDPKSDFPVCKTSSEDRQKLGWFLKLYLRPPCVSRASLKESESHPAVVSPRRVAVRRGPGQRSSTAFPGEQRDGAKGQSEEARGGHGSGGRGGGGCRGGTPAAGGGS